MRHYFKGHEWRWGRSLGDGKNLHKKQLLLQQNETKIYYEISFLEIGKKIFALAYFERLSHTNHFFFVIPIDWKKLKPKRQKMPLEKKENVDKDRSINTIKTMCLEKIR